MSNTNNKNPNANQTVHQNVTQIKTNLPNTAQPQAPRVPSAQEMNQKLYVKEQELNALKIQNRHLLTKLEEAEQKARPNQINTQVISETVQQNLQPVIAEIEKSLGTAFEMIQGTLRGIYQQSQRAQNAVDEMSSQVRENEMRMHDQRKADQVYFQEKIFSTVTAFCDRIERQIENRLRALSAVELMNTKQNEILGDLDQVKAMILTIQKNAETTQTGITRLEKESIEVAQKLIETQLQSRNTEEVARDGLQQIQNHRAEFKLMRGEVRSIVNQTSKLKGQINDQINNQTNEKADELPRAEIAATEEDLALFFKLVRDQKNELKNSVKEAQSYLQNSEITEANVNAGSYSREVETQEIEDHLNQNS